MDRVIHHFFRRYLSARRNNSTQSSNNRRSGNFEFSLRGHNKAMDLSKLTVILLLLAASPCWGKLVIEKTSKYEKSMAGFTDVLVDIVTSCHKGRTSGVGLAGRVPSTLYKRLTARHLIPVALMENYYAPRRIPDRVSKEFKQPLDTFIVGETSYKEFQELLVFNMRILRWWNHLASFYILDLSPGCDGRLKYLWLAWRCDVLHSTLLCRSDTGVRTAYTYNPYTDKGPATWRKEWVHPKIHTFNVFSRTFGRNETIACGDMFFTDKTSDLGGGEIRIRGRHEDYSKSTATTLGRGHYAFETRRRSIMRTLFGSLNATLAFDPSYYAIEAEPRGLQFTFQKQLVLTYPHRQVGASLITHFRGQKSQLTKMLSIIDADSWYGTVVVYLITLVFLKTFVRQTAAPALLNLVRMTCNVAFENLPDDTSSRIYLGCLLFFVVTMQGIFQGNLAARLTKYSPLRNVESIGDIEALGYRKICGNQHYRRAFEDSAMHEHFIVSDNERYCMMRVIEDSSIAYVGRVESFVIDLVEEFSLHISEKPVEMIYVGFPIYPFWVLTERVNAIISRLVEADALELWEIKCKPVELSDFYVDPMVRTNVDFKNMELHELSFAFVILGIGLAFATVVFVVELAVGHECVCDVSVSRRGDKWEERVVEASPDNRSTQ